MKVAIIEHSGEHACYECGGAIAHHVSDWAEVTTEEYKALKDYLTNRNALLVIYPTEENTTETIRQAIDAAMQKKDEAERKRKAAAERRAERERKKRLADEEAERLEFERLAQKFARTDA